MTLFISKKQVGKIRGSDFVTVLGSDGGTFLVEDSRHKIHNVSKRVFEKYFDRIM